MLSLHSCPTARLGERDAGGMNVYVRYVAQELAGQGIEVDVFARRHDPADPPVVEMSPGARLVHIDAGSPEAPKEDLYQYLPEFLHNLQEYVHRQHRLYDVVHSHYWLSGLVGQALSRAWGLPHVTIFHTLARVKQMARADVWEPPSRVEGEEQIATSAEAIVVSHPHEREALVQLYGVLSERVHVIPCGVDTELFHPMERLQSRHSLGLDGHPVVLFVGRADPVKGADLLLRAVAAIEEPSDVQVLMVGGDPQRDPEVVRLQTLAANLGLAERVRFEGIVPQEQLPLYYNAAEVLVMPSYAESFGLAALEAMACGTPVIAARVGGLASLVKEGDTGYLVPWHCPEPFAQRMEVLLSHPGLREAQGEAAWKYAQAQGWDAVARELAKVYQRLLSPRGSESGGRG